MRVRREIGVTDGEPRRLTEAREHLVRAERVAANAPAALGVDEPGERVEQRVDVGADVEAMDLEVVGDVGDDRELDLRADEGEAVRELRPAGAAREEGDPQAHASARRGFTSEISRSIVSASCGGGKPTIRCRKPISPNGLRCSTTSSTVPTG